METLKMTKPKDPGPRCPVDGCQKPEDAARMAVKLVFEILGVNVDDPHQVEEFRKGLRFSEDLLKYSNKGKLGVLLSLITLATGALWYALFGK
jgi:hypothetical protein